MNSYNPYFANYIHPNLIQQYQNPNSYIKHTLPSVSSENIQSQSFLTYPQTSTRENSESVEILKPVTYDNGRIVDYTRFFFTGHQFFKKDLVFQGALPSVTSDTRAFVSITEVDANNKPFAGAASLEIFNIVPDTDKITVMGRIWWDSDIRVRLSVDWMD